MLMPLSATKPRSKCAICKYWAGEKPDIPILGVFLIEKENEGCCSCKNSSNYNMVCDVMHECDCFEKDSKYSDKAIIAQRTNIKTLHIPKQVDSFPKKLHYDFKELEEIIVDEDNQNLCSVDGVLFTKDKKTLILYPPKRQNKVFRLPEELTSLADDSLPFNSRIDELDMGKSTIDIEKFSSCLIKAFSADSDNKAYCTECGIWYSKDMLELIAYPNAKEDYFFEVPIEVQSIHNADSYRNKYLREISISEDCEIDMTDIAVSSIETIHIKR